MSGAPLPPLIGRAAACARLLEALATERTPLVVGEAGIGKTALVTAAVEGTGRPLVAGAGFQTLVAMPYLALRVALGHPVAGTADDVAARVEAAVGDGVLFLDDLQWLDRETRAVIPLLVGRVALVLASRTMPDADAIPSLPPEPFTVVRLDPLGREDAEALLARHRAGLRPSELETLLGRAGGNPLLIEELAREGRPSATAARAIAHHVAGASADALDALHLLAVADRPLALPLSPAVEAELLDAGLARRAGDLLAVRHALLADAVLAGLDENGRRDAHARVAAHSPDEADAALHLARAGRADEAVARSLAALERTTDVRERAELLRIAAESSSGPRSLELRLDAAEQYLGLDNMPAALALLDGSPERLADGADLSVPGPLVEACGTWYARQAYAVSRAGDYAGGDSARDRARTYPLDPAGRAAFLVDMDDATMAATTGDIDRGLALLDRMAERTTWPTPGDRRVHFMMRALLRFMTTGEADVDALIASTDETIADSPTMAMGHVVNTLTAIWALQGPAAGLAYADRVIPTLTALGIGMTQARTERMQCLLWLGRETDAVVAADELLELPTAFISRVQAATMRATALCQLGRVDEAAASLASVEGLLRDEWMDRGEWLTVATSVAYWSGRPADAIRHAAAAAAVPTFIPSNLLFSALPRAWAEWELDREPGPLPEGGEFWIGDATYREHAALCLLASGAPAVESFDAAAGAWHERYRFRELVCRWAAGEAARREGRADAVTRLVGALEDAEAAGYAALAAKARRSLRLAGVDRREATDRRRASDLLTPREREILGHVAAGRSNIEIARRMGLGRPTVTRILSNAMTKLGAESRAQAVLLFEAAR